MPATLLDQSDLLDLYVRVTYVCGLCGESHCPRAEEVDVGAVLAHHLEHRNTGDFGPADR